jgi:predicted DNA binding CopG/RHH family protein
LRVPPGNGARALVAIGRTWTGFGQWRADDRYVGQRIFVVRRARFSRYAKATFKKHRRLNIRLSSKDLEAIQKRALAESLRYQTLISSLLHKYAAGRLKRSEARWWGRQALRRCSTSGG